MSNFCHKIFIYKTEVKDMVKVLYNPLAGNNRGLARAKRLDEIIKGKDIEYIDMTKLDSYDSFFSSLKEDDEVIVAGGDGTLNHFANDNLDRDFDRDIRFFPAGSGNDFTRDVGFSSDGNTVIINKYLKDLPTVTVDGKTTHFLNGLGYGLDGYCCQEGDRQRRKNPKKKINYTTIALKGLIYDYKRRNATVTVDGKEYQFKKVYISPVMHGRYYGGGFLPAPEQDRNDPSKLSVAVMYGCNKLKGLMVFPSVKTGKHVKHTEMITILSGHEISVEYDIPCALQIDGETVLDVKKITAKAAK